jgi:hypothetical protein
MEGGYKSTIKKRSFFVKLSLVFTRSTVVGNRAVGNCGRRGQVTATATMCRRQRLLLCGLTRNYWSTQSIDVKEGSE